MIWYVVSECTIENVCSLVEFVQASENGKLSDLVLTFTEKSIIIFPKEEQLFSDYPTNVKKDPAFFGAGDVLLKIKK